MFYLLDFLTAAVVNTHSPFLYTNKSILLWAVWTTKRWPLWRCLWLCGVCVSWWSWAVPVLAVTSRIRDQSTAQLNGTAWDTTWPARRHEPGLTTSNPTSSSSVSDSNIDSYLIEMGLSFLYENESFTLNHLNLVIYYRFLR